MQSYCLLVDLQSRRAKVSNRRKVTIQDAQNSFTLRITTINDFQNAVAELRNKYYNQGLTLQPLIVVVGASANHVTDFYVNAFNGTIHIWLVLIHVLNYFMF